MHAPPTPSDDEKLEHLLFALETSHEVKGAVAAVQEELAHLSTTQQEKSVEILQAVSAVRVSLDWKRIAAARARPPSAAAGGRWRRQCRRPKR